MNLLKRKKLFSPKYSLTLQFYLVQFDFENKTRERDECTEDTNQIKNIRNYNKEKNLFLNFKKDFLN